MDQTKRILSPLIVKHIDGTRWEVMEPFIYRVGSAESDEKVFVPKGFVFDFASIPRVAWSLIGSPSGEFGKPAAVHDKLYRAPVVIVGDRTVRAVTRAEADAIFLEASEVVGISWWRRRLAHRFVRLFAGGAWDRYRATETGGATVQKDDTTA